MKKLLTILLFFPLLVKAQAPEISLVPVISQVCGGGAASTTFTSFDFFAGCIYLMEVQTDSSANQSNTPSGTGQTWVNVASFGNGSRRIDIFRTACTSSHSDNINLTWTGFNIAQNTRIYQICGVPTTNNGADAIRQVVIDSGSLANPSITLAAITSISAVVSVWSRQNDIFAGTPESGWTENYDAGCTTGSYVTGYYLMSRRAGGDNTPSITASGDKPWIGVALEIIGLRRIFDAH